jgi:hypothetical protein
MSTDLSAAGAVLLAVGVGLPLMVVGVLSLGRVESWRDRRRQARRGRRRAGAK